MMEKIENVENNIKNVENGENVDAIATLKYLNNKMGNYKLPLYFEEFLTQIYEMFPKEKQLFILYNHEIKDENPIEEIIEIKNSDDYCLLSDRLRKKSVKENEILIETDKISAGISRKIPNNFEDNIKCVVERELEIAMENIKNSLSAKQINNSEFKVHKEKCCKCENEIFGNLYKDLMEDNKYYCEKCSFDSQNPLFIIH